MHANYPNHERDGHMTVDGNQAGAPNYFPNSFGGPEPTPSAEWHVDRASGIYGYVY
jgi:catalase